MPESNSEQTSKPGAAPSPEQSGLPTLSLKKIRVVTFISFIVAALLGITVVAVVEHNRLQSRQKIVREMTVRISDNIRDHLGRTLSATYALAAIISQQKGMIENFDQLASEMIPVYGSGINSLQLAPNGIISKIYPLQGNEKAIGLNVLTDPGRNKEAILALETRRLTLAGPFELKQGGTGLVGRLPVFIKTTEGADRFWGFTAVLIHVRELIKSANMQKLVDAGYNYELSRIHPYSGIQDIFARSTETPLHAPVHHSIEVPNNVWTLSVEPAEGWFSTPVISAELALVLLISALISFTIRNLYRQPIMLTQLVEERTRQLSDLNRQMLLRIEEQERSEKALRVSESRLNESQKVAHIGHYEYDITAGTWTNSKELNSIFGIDDNYTRDINGWLQIVHPEQHEEMFEYLSRHILEQHQAFNKEYRIRRISDKAERWVHGLGELEFDHDGRLVGMFGTIQDISDRKEIEAERLKLEQQMRHTQKLESLGVLAGGIAHDFNNIMMSILGNAELAMLRLKTESAACENLLNIEQSAQRAAELSRQMLAYSGKGHFILKKIELGELISETTRMLEISISKKVQLSLNLAKDLPPVEVDTTQIRQVLMNLVINGSEAIGDNVGEITIATGVSHYEPGQLATEWLGEDLPAGNYVYVEVADSGCGMERETIARIFDPFFTTKFTGRGLRMAAVMGIIRGHHGAISIKSQPGYGTTFRVFLPAASGFAEILNTGQGQEQLWRGHGTILLVDDEEVIRALGIEMLSMLGFDVLTASNGHQAVEIYRDKRDEIDAVILDMTMPKMNGEETFSELTRIDPQVCVILSSGYNEQEINKHFQDRRPAGFIQKPYKLNDMSSALKNSLRHTGESLR